jgi:mono/diheme cytochrome c family protein
MRLVHDGILADIAGGFRKATASRPCPDISNPPLCRFWKFLYFHDKPLIANPDRDPQWNRGQYLVEATAHCAECHSSRNLFGAIKAGTRFAGGTDPEGAGYFPNITPARIGDWTGQQIAEMLESGNTPNHGPVGSSMTDVVTNTSALPQSDRDAIAVYIKSLPARPTPRP